MRRTTRTFRLALALTSIGLSSLTVTVVATPALAAPASASTYTVVSGDTLYGIARKLGVSLNALLAANGMSATSTIHPGTVALLTNVFRQIEDDRHWQGMVLAGQSDQRLSRLRLHVRGVDDRQSASCEPFRGDIVQNLESIICRVLIVLVIAD